MAREKPQSSDPASWLFDEPELSSASSTVVPTPLQETPTSTGATEGELSPSSASALESARRAYKQLASKSGPQQEPSPGSSPAAGRLSTSWSELGRWAPIPRYIVAELERMGASRKQAVEAVTVAYMAAGGEVTREVCGE